MLHTQEGRKAAGVDLNHREGDFLLSFFSSLYRNFHQILTHFFQSLPVSSSHASWPLRLRVQEAKRSQCEMIFCTPRGKLSSTHTPSLILFLLKNNHSFSLTHLLLLLLLFFGILLRFTSFLKSFLSHFPPVGVCVGREIFFFQNRTFSLLCNQQQ